MKRSVFYLTFLIGASTLFWAGCGNDSTKRRNPVGPQGPGYPGYPGYPGNSNPLYPNTPSPGGNPGPGATTPGPGTPVAPSPETPATDYYTIKITAHGGSADWSSYASQIRGNINQEILRSDSRFKLRIKALPAPRRNTIDDFGVTCRNMPVGPRQGYGALGVNVKLSSRESGNSGQTHTFSGIQIGQVSQAYSFKVPASNHPLVLTVSDPEWDTSCYTYKQQGLSGYGVDSVCPYSAIWNNDCYQIELQFVTDHTSDF